MIFAADLSDEQAIEILWLEKNCPDNRSHAWQLQCSGKHSIMIGPDSPYRVVNQSTSFGSSLLSMGHTVDDLFATYANKKLHHFACLFPDPWVTCIDAMSILWSGLRMVYAFPPFKMIPAVLKKIWQSSRLTVILIALYLMTASWMPELYSICGVRHLFPW